MRSKILLGAVVLAASCAGLLGTRRVPSAIADDPCPPAAIAGVATIQGERLATTIGVSVVDEGERSALRHPAATNDVVAFVRDGIGDDTLVLARPGRDPVEIPQPGEVAHPAWGPAGTLAWGLDDTVVVRASDGTMRTIAGPKQSGSVIAPAFEGGGLVAVVGAEPTVAVPEDEWSDDLWRYEGERWRRLTRFPADADRWTAIRTPMAAPDGSLEFVVASGRASATELPRFALWRLRGEGITLVRTLPDEAYLAGFEADGSRLWNVPDRATGRWLVRDDAGGTLGCGAVAVDPIDVVDPDRTGQAAPAPEALDVAPSPGDPAEIALVVGDFASREDAGAIAERIAAAYAGALPVDLVHGGEGVTAVREGAWAVLIRLGGDTDGVGELARLRAMLPDLADRSWITVP